MYRNVSHPYIDGDCENVVSASMCDITKKPFVLRLNVMDWYLKVIHVLDKDGFSNAKGRKKRMRIAVGHILEFV